MVRQWMEDMRKLTEESTNPVDAITEPEPEGEPNGGATRTAFGGPVRTQKVENTPLVSSVMDRRKTTLNFAPTAGSLWRFG